jgi:3-methylfumaryl-CoA hydratase
MLKKFSMRAQSAAFSGEPLHLVSKNEGQKITLAAIGNDGRTVMTAETSK